MDYRHRGSFWRQNIFAALQALGGSGSLQDIYLWMEANAGLSNQDLRDWGGVGPMYQHTVRRYLTNMCRKGEVARLDRGFYRLC